jgi:holo-[acyl-carrier protein] synthase
VDVKMGIKVGTDIVNIKRIQASYEKFGTKFLDRFLNKNEQKIANKIETIAGFWAAKEAVAKALETGIGKELSFLDIEIYKKSNNVPYFLIKRKNFNIIDSSVSISHDGNFAIAVAIVVIK